MAFPKAIKNLISELPLNYNERAGLHGIVSELTDKYPLIKKAILYGSKARGDFLEDSSDAMENAERFAGKIKEFFEPQKS